jgi:hypothetical protein
MAVTRSSPGERGSAGCSESVNQSQVVEREVVRCSIEDRRTRSGVAITPHVSNPYDYVNHMFKRP